MRVKVFVSWSGEASHDVAKALKSWLPVVLQGVDVFLSSEDIDKGTRWFEALGGVLAESRFAILCLTPENLSAPWILYEAGAIAHQMETSRVTPLLVGLDVTDLDAPLVEFNATRLERDDLEKLFAAINKQLGPKRLDERTFQAAFDAAWPKLERALAKAKAKAVPAAQTYTYDVFLSTPMASFQTDDDFKLARKEMAKIFEALKACGLRVFWATEKIESMADFDTFDVSAMDDLKALDESRIFVLLLPQKMVTSALFEAGYALCKKLLCHYFVRDREDLPFLMRELPGALSNVRIHDRGQWKDYDDLAKKISKQKKAWFPS